MGNLLGGFFYPAPVFVHGVSDEATTAPVSVHGVSDEATTAPLAVHRVSEERNIDANCSLSIIEDVKRNRVTMRVRTREPSQIFASRASHHAAWPMALEHYAHMWGPSTFPDITSSFN